MRTTRLEDFTAKLALDIDDDVNNITIEMGLGTMGSTHPRTWHASS